MQADFHYYAAYCAACLAGWSHEESLLIAWSDQFTDCCSRTFLTGIHAPRAAATTQTQTELMDARTDFLGLQEITRIWASFHFLPGDLYADPPRKTSRRYRNKYRLICGPNGSLAGDTVQLAKDRGLPAAGLAMHILSDTWAHRFFAGTPSLVINNTSSHFYELLPGETGETKRRIRFRHNPGGKDDPEQGIYTGTLYQASENAVMNLGHGRAGHLPDYSFIRYCYLPAWGEYGEMTKDNPSDYYHAFCQMIHALKYLRGSVDIFETGTYDAPADETLQERILAILTRRQTDASADWKALGESLSGRPVEDFDPDRFTDAYRQADAADKDATILGQYILAALAQKSMVTAKIAQSGNPLAGTSVTWDGKKLPGIRDYLKLVELAERSGT